MELNAGLHGGSSAGNGLIAIAGYVRKEPYVFILENNGKFKSSFKLSGMTEARTVTPARDGSLLVGGRNKGSFVITKTSIDGKKIWKKTISARGWAHITKIVEFNDSSLGVVGVDFGGSADRDSIFISRLSTKGKVMWKKLIPTIYDGRFDNAYVDENDNFIVSHLSYRYVRTARQARKLIVNKITPNGQIIKEKTFNSSAKSNPTFLRFADGNYSVLLSKEKDGKNVVLVNLNDQLGEVNSKDVKYVSLSTPSRVIAFQNSIIEFGFSIEKHDRTGKRLWRGPQRKFYVDNNFVIGDNAYGIYNGGQVAKYTNLTQN